VTLRRERSRLFGLLIGIGSLMCSGTAFSAAAPIEYRLAMPQPAAHLFVVTIILNDNMAPSLDFQMPAWSPGRYAIYDFARNVQDFRAQGGHNEPLTVEKIDKQTWRVHAEGSHRVAVEYKIFADTLSGTFSQLNDQHANYNGASTYMYVVGMKDRAVNLTIAPPKGWTVLNGFQNQKSEGDIWIGLAPNYDILIDCPTEIAPLGDHGPIWLRSFTYGGKTFRVVIHNNGADKNLDRFVGDLEKIVKTEFAVMGPPDFETYTFLFHFNPFLTQGDGMEHLSSTQIVVTANLGDESRYERLLLVAAHEFFHAWNVKRLRPAALGPWDYTKEDYTKSLWISEGLTSYYASVTLRRSGLWTDQKYFEQMAGVIEMIQNSPGRFERSAEEASFDTWLWPPPPYATNWQNVFLSYYTKGEILGALLDLEIRNRTNNKKSLDEVFRYLYKTYYEAPQATYYQKGRGFEEEDFLKALSTVTGSDFSDFWKVNISESVELDYNRYLKAAGLYLDAHPGETTVNVGISLRETADHLPQIENVAPGSPASAYGLSSEDILLALDGERVSDKHFNEVLSEKHPGQKVVFTVYRENRLLNIEVVLGSHEPMTYSIKEMALPSDMQKQIRASWLGTGK
jgi:predicted metalloprotease with PDZ domain